MVEARELRIRVEDLRRRIAELEASNQTLGHRSGHSNYDYVLIRNNFKICCLKDALKCFIEQ